MNKSWFYRTLLSYIPVFFIVTAFLFFIFFYTLNDQNKKQTYQANQFVAQQAIRFIDTSLKSIDEKLTLEIMRNQDFLQFFSADQGSDLNLDVKVMNSMRDLKITNPLIDSIYLVRYKDQVVLSNSTSYSFEQFADYAFIQSLAESPNRSWSDQRAFSEFSSETSRQVITLSRGVPIFDPQKGIVVINVKTDSLQNQVSQLYNPKVSFMHLFDRQGKNLFHGVDQDQGYDQNPDQGQEQGLGLSQDQDQSLGLGQTEAERETAAASKGAVSTYVSDYTGWTIESGIRQTGIIGFILSLYNIWIAVGIIVVIAAIIWMIIVTKRNYKPIELIVSKLQLHSKDRAEIPADVKDWNEMTFIESTLVNMIKESNEWERQFAEDLHVKRNYFMYELLEGTRQIGLEEWERQAPKFELPGTFGLQMIFIMEIDRYMEFCEEYNQADQKLLKFVVSTVIKESAAANKYNVWTLWTSANQLTGVIQIPLNSSSDPSLEPLVKPLQVLEEIRAWMEQNLHFTGTIGVGEIVEHPMNVRDSFKEALEALQYKMVYGANRVISHQEVQAATDVHEHLQLIHTIAGAYRASQGKWEVELEHFFEKISSSVLIRDDIISLLNSLTFYLNRSIGSLGNEFLDLWKASALPKLHDILETFETLEEIHKQYPIVLEQFAKQMGELRESRNHHMLINEVKGHIQNHFTNPNLSLDYLSDQFGMNGKYLSKLFKEEFGTKFVDFLIDLRMQHAKQLLTETTLTVQEIAEKVGYASPISFIRTFKKATGVPPGDYRKER